MIRNQSTFDEERRIFTPGHLLLKFKKQFFHWRNNKLHIYRNLDWSYKLRFVLFFVFFHPIYLTGVFLNLPILLSSIYQHTSYILTISVVLFWPFSVFYTLFASSGSIFFGIHTSPDFFQFVRLFYSVFLLSCIFISLLWYETNILRVKSMNVQLKITVPVMQVLSVATTVHFLMVLAQQTGSIDLSYSIILVLEAMFVLPLSMHAIYHVISGPSFWLSYIIIMYSFLIYSLMMTMIITKGKTMLEHRQSNNSNVDPDKESRFRLLLNSVFGVIVFIVSKFAGIPAFIVGLFGAIRTASEVHRKQQEMNIDNTDELKTSPSELEDTTSDTEQIKLGNNLTPKVSTPPPKSSQRIQYVVDGSNICWENRNQEDGPDVGRIPRLIIQLREQYKARMEDIVVYVSPALRHQLQTEGDLEIFNILLANKTIKQGPAHEDDDIFIIQQALSNPNTKIISNDLYRDNYTNFNGLEEFVKDNQVSVSYDDFNLQFLFGSNI